MGVTVSKLHYHAEDVAILPVFLPVVKSFEASQLRHLSMKLKTSTTNYFLSQEEFSAWMEVDQTTGSRSKANFKPKNTFGTTSSLFQNYVSLIFQTLKSKKEHKKVYVLEFLASLVICSHTILKIEEKASLIFYVFDLHGTDSLTRTDVSLLILSTINGLKKITAGLGEYWKYNLSGIVGSNGNNSTSNPVQHLTDSCMNYAMEINLQASRNETEARTLSTADSCIETVGRRAFVQWMARNAHASNLVRHFMKSDLLNPFAFNPYLCESSGTRVSEGSRKQFEKTSKVYDEFLEEKRLIQESRGAEGAYVTETVSLNELKVVAATIKIQSLWRKYREIPFLNQQKLERTRKMNDSASLLQRYIRRRIVAQILEKHAQAEKESLNGGMFVFGAASFVKAGVQQRKPKVAEYFKLNRIKLIDVAVSKRAVVCLAQDNSVYIWGNCIPCKSEKCVSLNREYNLHFDEPCRINFDTTIEKISQISCGIHHIIFLDTNGAVYSLGFNDHGQLGHGDGDRLFNQRAIEFSAYKDERTYKTMDVLQTATPLIYFEGYPKENLPGIRISKVCCGDHYTLALSYDGEVFSWGEGSDGQLGHGFSHEYEVGYADETLPSSFYTYLSIPHQIEGLKGTCIKLIACGGNHNAAVASNYDVYEWGIWGRRRGDIDHPPSGIPELQEDSSFRKMMIDKIAVGNEHIIAEGASMWARFSKSEGITSREFYILPAAFCAAMDTLDTILEMNLHVQIYEVEVDDLEGEEDDISEGNKPDGSSVSSENLAESVDKEKEIVIERKLTFEEHSKTGAQTNEYEMWQERESKFRCSVDHILKSVSISSTKQTMQLLQDMGCVSCEKLSAQPQREFRYEELLDGYFQSVKGKIAMINRNKLPGAFVEFDLSAPTKTGSPDTKRKKKKKSCIHHFKVTPSTPWTKTINNIGILSHLYVLPPDEGFMYHTRNGQVPDSIVLMEFSEKSLKVELDKTTTDKMVELLIDAIRLKLINAQKAGALAVIIAFQFHGAEPFEIDFRDSDNEESVQIPVCMVDMKTANRMKNIYYKDSSSKILARLFNRVETLMRQIESCVRNGALGVIVQQSKTGHGLRGERTGSVEVISRKLMETRRGKIPKAEVQAEQTLKDCNVLVGMVSWPDGESIRNVSNPTVSKSSDYSVSSVNLSFHRKDGGNLFSWGYGEDGRLGIGELDDGNGQHVSIEYGFDADTNETFVFSSKPNLIPSTIGTSMRTISCGMEHSVAVTKQGKVFTWGTCDNGQLGHAQRSEDVVLSPKEIAALTLANVVHAHANDTCTFAICEAVSDSVFEKRQQEIKLLKKASRTETDNNRIL